MKQIRRVYMEFPRIAWWRALFMLLFPPFAVIGYGCGVMAFVFIVDLISIGSAIPQFIQSGEISSRTWVNVTIGMGPSLIPSALAAFLVLMFMKPGKPEGVNKLEYQVEADHIEEPKHEDI